MRIGHLDVADDLTLTPVEHSLEGTVAYAVAHDDVPLGLLVSYLDETPTVWWAYARYSREARLAMVGDAPFVRAQAALDAVDAAICRRSATPISA